MKQENWHHQPSASLAYNKTQQRQHLKSQLEEEQNQGGPRTYFDRTRLRALP